MAEGDSKELQMLASRECDAKLLETDETRIDLGYLSKPNCAVRGVCRWKIPCPRLDMTKDGWVMGPVLSQGTSKNKRRLVRGLSWAWQ